MAFIKVGTLTPFGAPVLRSDVLANSITVTVADMVTVQSGFVQDCSGTTFPIFGNLVSIVQNKGVGEVTSGAAGAGLGSFINQYTTSSTNQTVAMARAVTDIAKSSLYTNPTSGTPGFTTGSNLLGYYLNLVAASATTVDETSATTTKGTSQFFNFGLQPGSTTLIVVSIETGLI